MSNASGRRSGLPGAWSSLAYPEWRRIWIALLFRHSTTFCQVAATGALIVTISPNTTSTSLAYAVSTAPTVALIFLGGYFSTRFGSKNLVILSQLVTLCLIVAIFGLVAIGKMSIGVLINLLFVIGCAEAVSSSIWTAALVTAVPAEHLKAAATTRSAAFHLARPIGAMIAFVATTYLGLEAGFICAILLCSLSIAAAAIAEFGDDREQVAPHRAEGKAHGFLLPFRNRSLAGILRRQSTTSFCGSAFLSLLPMLPLQLDYGASVYGILLAAFGLGSCAITLCTFKSAAKADVHIRLLWHGIAFAVSLLSLSFSFGLYFTILLIVVMGCSWTAMGALLTSEMLIRCPEEGRKTIVAVFQASWTASSVLGALVWGFIASKIGVQLTYAAAALTYLVLIFAVGKLSPVQPSTQI